ncbi:MAG: UDP-N-acetylmuramate--L-alanine ligase [Alphaproteobacteria bacterium]|nr:UDP-N-acetylmuramate--L-alanine ligase [Alphaproteobacteria bacterium]
MNTVLPFHNKTRIPLEVGAIHFVGIGGIGMSGIAEILHHLGYTVQGSDAAENANVKRLRMSGIKIFTAHDASNLGDATVVVISSAIKKDNAELIAAREKHIPIVRRAEMLGELMRLKWAIAIGGTHGKTTTTSLVGAMLETAGKDPTVINGGIINAYGTNARLGDGEWMVVESDESDGSFTKLPATVAVVTNIDPEHMEHYGSFDAVRKAYDTFVSNIPFYGFAVLCTDHPEVQAMIPRVSDRRLITYGTNAQADVRASNIETGAFGARFDVIFNDNLLGPKYGTSETVTGIDLPMYGQHNILNALAAIAVGRALGIATPVMREALAKFSGVKRRFTKIGVVNNITVIDDYGHHPVEIAAVLSAAKTARGGTGRTIAVVQPHRYTRLQSLFNEFCTCFNEADTVIVADVYAAGEQPIDGFDRDALVEGLRKHGHRHVHALASADVLPNLIADLANPNDLVVCLGAGNITSWAQQLPQALEAIYSTAPKKTAKQT